HRRHDLADPAFRPVDSARTTDEGSEAASLVGRMRARTLQPISRKRAAAFLEELGCEFVVADLTDPDAVSGAAAGCEVIVHSAAQLGMPASMDRHVEVNVEGTRRILKEAIDSAVRRFVHISSVAAYGAPFDESILPLDEETPLDDPIPEEDHYSLTKRMAEEVVRKVGRRIEWCILRPDIVMGERDRLFTPRILRWASRPVLSTLGMGANDLPLVYAGNVALAVWLAATQDAAAWQTYNVTDDGELTQKTLVRIAAGRGPDAPVLPVPVPLVAAACRIGTVFGRIIPGVRPGVLTPRRIRLFTEGDPYDGALIREELGWKPTVSTEDGWRRSVEWYRAYMARKASTGLEVRNEA
ncbi:MAG: NAD-dependent epimerase/dehydratase family protein, partial [Gemmatimonadales bacterium]